MLCGLGHRRSGDDSDTVGAIFGTLAGAFYGYRVIPPSWATAVTFAPFLVHVADCLAVLADAVVPTPTPGDSVTWTLAVDAVPRRTALLLQLMDTLQVEYTALRGRMQPGPRRLTDRAAVDAAIDEFGGRHRGWLVDHGALLSSAGTDVGVAMVDTVCQRLVRDADAYQRYLTRQAGVASGMAALAALKTHSVG